MNPLKRVFIAGSSGEIGKRLLDNLIARNSVGEIHLLVRTATDTIDPRIHQHIVDFNNLSTLQIPNPGNLPIISYCTLGSTIKKAGSKENFQKVDLTYVENFALWSLNNDCKKLAVISSVDANQTGGNFYLKTKGEMESTLKKRPFDALWIMRPSLLLGTREEFRLGEKLGGLAAKLITPLLMGPYEKYKPIEMDTVAKALSSLVDNNNSGIHILESGEIKKLASSNQPKLERYS